MRRKMTVLLPIFAALLMLAGCGKAITMETIDKLEYGMPRTDILDVLGEPKASLFGMFGDIYEVGDTRVILYYTVDETGAACLSEIKTDPAQ